MAIDAADLGDSDAPAGFVFGQDGAKVANTVLFACVGTLAAAAHDAGQVVFGARGMGSGIGGLMADDGLHEYRIDPVLKRGIADGWA